MGSAKVVITLPNTSILLEGSEEFVERHLTTPVHLQRSVDMMTSEKSEVARLAASSKGLEHSWQWFSLHAGQRMQGVNFFLVAAAFLTGALVTALQAHDKLIAVAVGLFGAFIAVCFSRLDLRVRELIHAGEAGMKPLQATLAEVTGVTELQILKNVECPKNPVTKYSQIIRLLHWSSVVIFLLGAVYALIILP
jgi:hypothetical protein